MWVGMLGGITCGEGGGVERLSTVQHVLIAHGTRTPSVSCRVRDARGVRLHGASDVFELYVIPKLRVAAIRLALPPEY